jgi:hypothetical protein
MKNGMALLLLLLSAFIYSQEEIPATGCAQITFDDFTGAGFANYPAAGQLDSDEWAVEGLSDGDLGFGDSQNTGDFARGIDSNGVTTGGIYSFEVEPGNFALGVQPGASDFTPGTFSLKLVNAIGNTITKVNVKYDLWCLNNENRSNSFNFSYSTDGNTYIELSGLDYVSMEAEDTAAVWIKTEKVISISVSIADGAEIYLRWISDDHSGAGSRDEFAIDDIRVSANENKIPVELKSFQGMFNGNSVELNWVTATEVNNYGFEIERNTIMPSASSLKRGLYGSWEKAGFLRGAGNSNIEKKYSYTDNVQDLNLNPTLSYRLKQIDIDGLFEYSNEVEIKVNNISSKFTLEQNYPNPFNPVTTIKYSIPSVGAENFLPVQLKIYNLLGQEVATLVNEPRPPGNYDAKFDASNLSSGIYLYKLRAGDFKAVRKLLLLK